MLLKITEKGVAHVSGTTPDGKTVTISAYKSPSVFRNARGKNVGEEFEAGELLTSNEGRLYSATRIDVEKALFEAEKMDSERALLALKIRVATAQAAALEG